MSILKKIFSQPISHFFILGLLVFIVADMNTVNEFSTDKNLITIKPKTIENLAELYGSQMGALPSDLELDSLLNKHIDDEIYYREALRLGLDNEDEIIKQRLIQKMRYLSSLSSTSNEVSESDLRGFFDDNSLMFTIPEKVSFQHVFFSPDQDSYSLALQRAKQAFILLRQNEVESLEVGDHFALQNNYTNLTQMSAAQLFGKFPLVEALFAENVGQWQGPFQSGFGLHLLYINRRSEQTVADFNAVRSQVMAAYQDHQKQITSEINLQKFRQHYQIMYD